MSEVETRGAIRGWLFDLHRSGRVLSTELQREVEQIAVLVVGCGGSMQEAFLAARSILPQPRRLEPAH